MQTPHLSGEGKKQGILLGKILLPGSRIEVSHSPIVLFNDDSLQVYVLKNIGFSRAFHGEFEM